MTERTQKKLIKKLESLGWLATNCWKDDGWISPYTKIEYTFYDALVISDIKFRG